MKRLLQTYTSSSYSASIKIGSKSAPHSLIGKNVVLLHENARPHTRRVTQEKFVELGWSVLPHLPYFPDLAPSDYHLFRSLQNSLMGTNFSNEDQVQRFIENFFTSKLAEFYAKRIEELPDK